MSKSTRKSNPKNRPVDPEDDQTISGTVSTLPVASPASMMHELAATVGRVMHTPLNNMPNTRSALFQPSSQSPSSPDHIQSSSSGGNISSSKNTYIPINSGMNVVPTTENNSSLATSDAVVGMLLQMQEQLNLLMTDRKNLFTGGVKNEALPVSSFLPIPSDTRIPLESNRTKEEEKYPLTDLEISALQRKNIKIENIKNSMLESPVGAVATARDLELLNSHIPHESHRNYPRSKQEQEKALEWANSVANGKNDENQKNDKINTKAALKAEIARLKAKMNELPGSDGSSSDGENNCDNRKNPPIDDDPDFEPEEDDSYVQWLLLREKLYPYHRHPKLYKSRHTLLSVAGRLWEYIRTLVMTRGGKKLFPSQWLRKYHFEANAMGIELNSRIRPIDTKSLIFPGWFVDERDIVLATRSIVDNDLNPHSATLSELPPELRVDPPGYRKITMLGAGVEEILKYYMRQLKLYETSREPIRGIMVHDNAFDALDDDSATAPSVSTPAKTFAVKMEDDMPSLLPDPYEHPELFLKTRKDQTEVRKESLLYPPTPGPLASDTQTVKKHVLDPIFARFDENTQNMMRVLRITTPLKDKERNAEIDRIIKSLKVFKGVEYTAPSWYYEYCVAVSTLDLTTAECLKIMRQRMEGNGKAWLDGALARTIKQYTDDIYIMPLLMGQFRDQYMGESTATALRDKLLTMKLTDTGLNLTELKSHYESFATTMTNHRVCDPTMTEATYKQMYVDNMPARIKMFMGMSYQSCENVDKVFQIAEKAVNSLPKLRALNLNEMEVTYVPVATYPNTVEINLKIQNHS